MKNMEEYYPVYIVLFSNDTETGRLIRKATNSEYTHASITLYSDMNDMYSFSNIPFNHNFLNGRGFVRESIYSPEYRRNRFFTVLLTFVKYEEKNIIQQKIDYFKENVHKFTYNTIGLIQYYFNFKEVGAENETNKLTWFCSEFVSFICKSANIKNFDNLMLSPADISNIKSDDIFNLGNYTISTFKESDIKKKTNEAKLQFIRNRITIKNIQESHYNFYKFNYEPNVLKEFSINDILKFKKREYEESLLHKYSLTIDWKKLYERFISLFPSSNIDVRFDLFEIILTKYFIKFKRNFKFATEEIITEMRNIYKIVDSKTISSVNIDKSEITIVNRGGEKATYKYPYMTK